MICKRCGNDYPDKLFYKELYTGGKSYKRKVCKKYHIELGKIRRNKNREWYIEYKKTLSCENCGFTDYKALVFHHINSEEKDFNIAGSLDWSQKRIMEEINKCKVLCANCHTILHSTLED